jgi:hypothetical protein
VTSALIGRPGMIEAPLIWLVVGLLAPLHFREAQSGLPRFTGREMMSSLHGERALNEKRH